jgi:hypothetical protein
VLVYLALQVFLLFLLLFPIKTARLAQSLIIRS